MKPNFLRFATSLLAMLALSTNSILRAQERPFGPPKVLGIVAPESFTPLATGERKFVQQNPRQISRTLSNPYIPLEPILIPVARLRGQPDTPVTIGIPLLQGFFYVIDDMHCLPDGGLLVRGGSSGAPSRSRRRCALGMG